MKQLTYILDKIDSYVAENNIIKEHSRIFLNDNVERKAPFMFTYLTDDISYTGVAELTLRILVLDLLKIDNSNLEHILNDLMFVCVDLVEYLDSDDDLYTISNIKFTPLKNSMKELMAGYEISLTFTLGNNCFYEI